MRIKIKNLKLKVLLGLYEHERTAKQTVILNVVFEPSMDKAAETDNIKDAINYHKLVDEIREKVEKTEFFLIERLSQFILDIIKANPAIRSAEIEIDKPDAPIEDIDSVSITRSFTR